jgi:hypothetical protein
MNSLKSLKKIGKKKKKVVCKTASLRFARLSSSRIELTQTLCNNLRSLQVLFMFICSYKQACFAYSQNKPPQLTLQGFVVSPRIELGSSV